MKGIIACLCFGGLCGIAGTTALAVESEGFRNFAQINKNELAIIQKQEESLNEQGKELAQAKEITETITKENEQIKADKTALSAELETAKADLETALANGELQESEIAEKQEKITELENQIIEKDREVILNQTLVNTINMRDNFNYPEKLTNGYVIDFRNKVIVQNNATYGLTEPGYYDVYQLSGIQRNSIYFDGTKIYKVTSTNLKEISSFQYDSTNFSLKNGIEGYNQITYFVKKDNYVDTANQYNFEYIKNVDSETFDLKNGKGKVLQIGDMFKLDIGYGNKPVLIDETNTYEIIYCSGLPSSKAITLINKNDISKSVVINKIDGVLSYYYISDTATIYTDIEIVEEKQIERVYQDNYFTIERLSYTINTSIDTLISTHRFAVGETTVWNPGFREFLTTAEFLDLLVENVYRVEFDNGWVTEFSNHLDNGNLVDCSNINFRIFNGNNEEISIEDINNEVCYCVTLMSEPIFEKDEDGNITYFEMSLQVFPVEEITAE